MIDALIKRVYVTYKCYEMYRIVKKTCNCSCFEIDQEMDDILHKHVLLRHQSYLIVFMGNIYLRLWQIDGWHSVLQVINFPPPLPTRH
jgi:hypothetical protein